MFSKCLFLTCLSVVGTVAVGHSAPQADNTVLRKQVFAWLDKVKGPVLQKPLIYVETWDKSAGEKQGDFENREYGFGLRAGKGMSLLASIDLGTTSIEPVEEGQGRESGKVDFKVEVPALLTHMEAKLAHGNPISWGVIEPVVLSRLAETRGDSALSSRLFRFAQKVAGKKPLMEELQVSVGVGEFGDITDSVFGARESWAATLNRLNLFLVNFPSNPMAERAREYARILRQTLASESRTPVLLRNLREVDAEMTSAFKEDPTHTGHPSNAYATLALQDWKAIPLLIGALTDPSLTRASADQEMPMEEYRIQPILKVGDLALDLLQGITFQSFEPDSTVEMTWADQMSASRRLAEKWWREHQDQRELDLLSEAVLQGDPTSRASKTLALRFPKQAPAVFGRYFSQHLEESGIDMIEALGYCPGEESEKLLQMVLVSKVAFGWQVTAAQSLYKINPERGLKTMIDQWEHLSEDKYDEGVAENAGMFMASTRRPEAIAAIGKGILGRSEMVRRTVLYVFMDGAPTRYGHEEDTTPEPETPALVAFRASIEAILVQLLEDKRPADTRLVNGGTIEYDGKEIDHPRMCDSAARNLAMLLPTKYPFQILRPLAERDALIERFREIYRRSQ